MVKVLPNEFIALALDFAHDEIDIQKPSLLANKTTKWLGIIPDGAGSAWVHWSMWSVDPWSVKYIYPTNPEIVYQGVFPQNLYW